MRAAGFLSDESGPGVMKAYFIVIYGYDGMEYDI